MLGGVCYHACHTSSQKKKRCRRDAKLEKHTMWRNTQPRNIQCLSTVHAMPMPKLEGMNSQTNWPVESTSHLAYSVAERLEDVLSKEDHIIAALIILTQEQQRKERDAIPSSEDRE